MPARSPDTRFLMLGTVENHNKNVWERQQRGGDRVQGNGKIASAQLGIRMSMTWSYPSHGLPV